MLYSSLLIRLNTPLLIVPTNANQAFINPNSYYENPDGNKPSGGDTQYLIESQTANHSLLEKLFSDGTWNVFTAATSNYMWNYAI